MRRAAWSVCACGLLDAFTGATVTAQDLGPRFYMYDSPGFAGWSDERIQPIVRLHVDGLDPAVAAQRVAARIDQLVSSGVLDPAHLSITLQNFGEWLDADSGHRLSLLDPLDAITPPPDWPDPDGPYDPLLGLRQPWMNHAIPRVRGWMEGFLTAWDSLTYTDPSTGQPTALPVPARFFFDVEVWFSSCCSVDLTRMLQGIAGDQRFDTEAVPGFAGLTLAQLYAQACVDYGWPPETLGEALDGSSGPNSDRNRPYFDWYSMICAQARDGVLQETAYGPIHGHWPGFNGGPSQVLVSNFGDTRTDGFTDTFGWYLGRDPATGLRVPTRTGVRGIISAFSVGDSFIQGDLRNPATGWYSTWGVDVGCASADLSSPVLYTYDAQQRHDSFYLPPGPLGNPPQESQWDASLRCHRYAIEAILNTPGGCCVAPWILFPHTISSAPSGQLPYVCTDDDIRRELALLRSKNVADVAVWWNAEGSIPQVPTRNEWLRFRRLVDQVYAPRLTALGVWRGSPSFPVTPAQVSDSVRTGTPLDTAVLLATADGSGASAGLIGQFAGLATRLGTTLRLMLECTVDDPTVRGQVLLYSAGDWTPVPCDDFGPAGTEFGFFAGSSDGAYEARRTLSLVDPAPFLTSDGSLLMVVVLSRPTGGANPGAVFTASFDLMQVMWADDADRPGHCSADYDQDGDSATDADIEAFFACLAGDCCGSCEADFNGDGEERTDADIESFFRVLAGGPC